MLKSWKTIKLSRQREGGFNNLVESNKRRESGLLRVKVVRPELRSRSRYRSWSRSESTVLAGLESELVSIRLCRLWLRSGVAYYHPSTDEDFGRTVIHPENIGRQEEESGSV